MWLSFVTAFVAILAYPVYSLVRIVLTTVRDAIWWANGTHAAILESRLKKNYSGSVQVLGIAWRHKLDVLISVNSLSDFILYHERFDSPDYLLRSEVSLYCITPRDFVFIQCADGDTAWDVKDFGFSKEGQFRKARRVLLLPIEAAHRLAEEMGGSPKEKLIFVLNTARCGSTLACRIFQNTAKCVAYAEPSPFNDLLRDASKPNDPAAEKLIKTTVTLMCKPISIQIEAHALKLMPFSISMAPTFHKLFPNSSFVFLYRDLKKTCRSFLTLPMLPGGLILAVSQAISIRLWNYIAWRNGLNSPYNPRPAAARQWSTICGLLAIMPLMAMRAYLKLRNRDVSVAAIRYKDLIGKPTDTLRELFEYCGLAQDLVEPAMRDFSRDAQENSPLSQAKRAGVAGFQPTEKDMKDLVALCEAFGVPDPRSGDFVLPGTICTGTK